MELSCTLNNTFSLKPNILYWSYWCHANTVLIIIEPIKRLQSSTAWLISKQCSRVRPNHKVETEFCAKVFTNDKMYCVLNLTHVHFIRLALSYAASNQMSGSKKVNTMYDSHMYDKDSLRQIINQSSDTYDYHNRFCENTIIQMIGSYKPLQLNNQSWLKTIFEN